MFYTNEEYKEVFNIFLNERKGNIVKLNHVDIYGKGTIIGNLIRAEVKNDEETALIIVNLALNKRYINHRNDRIKFSIKDFKFFAIKHILNIDIEKYNIYSFLDIDNVDEIIKYVESFNLPRIKIKNYVLKNLLNVKNYYKNKKIKLLLI